LLQGKGFPLDSILPSGADSIAKLTINDRSISCGKAVHTMHKHMDDKHFNLTKAAVDPYSIIIILDKIYQSDNSTRLISLFRELCSLHMEEGADAHSYVLKFEDLVLQLNKYKVFDSTLWPALFLATLPTSWSGFVTAIQVATNYKASALK
jgi:hypothetical protein